VYKFQTSWGPDRDAEGIEREGNGEGMDVPLPSRLRGLGSVVSSPSRVRLEPRQKTSFGIFYSLKKNTPDRHKSIIFDISGRPRRPDRNARRDGLWPAGRMLDTPALGIQTKSYNV